MNGILPYPLLSLALLVLWLLLNQWSRSATSSWAA